MSSLFATRARRVYSLAIATFTLSSLPACTEIDFSQGGGAGGAANPMGGATGEGAAGASTGTAPTHEVCGNGVDDEVDGLVDCDDPECSAFCNEVPPGWTGFVSLRADGCAPDETLAQRGYVSASGDSACSCTCSGTPFCISAQATVYGGTNCGGGASTVSLMAGCTNAGSPGSDSLTVDSIGTGCSGSPSAELVTPTPTTSSVDLCNDLGGDCVFAPGMIDCPTGFPVSQLYQANLTDSRSCDPTNCDCLPSCGAVALHQDTDCADLGTPIPPGSCVNALGPYRISLDPNVQVCMPSGTATGSGAVSLSDPITVCCR